MKKNRTLTLVLMIIIVGFLNSDQNIMNSTLMDIEKEFRVNDADIGLMSGLFTLFGAAVSIIWGYLSDKKNRKMLFVYSIVIAQIPCLLTAFSADYTQFFILRILTGVGVGVSFPITFSMLGDMYDEKKRAAAVTWMTMVIGLGQIAGQILGGYLGPVLGWRIPFILAAIPGLIALVLFYFVAPEPRRGESEEALKQLIAEGFVYSKTIKPSDFIELAKIKTNVYLFIQGIVGTIPWGAIPLFLVKFFSENKGLSVEEATTVFLSFGIGTTVGIIAGGLWGGMLFKKNPAHLPVLCSLTTIASALVTIFMFTLLPGRSLVLTIVLGLVASFMSSITNPNMKTMLLDVNVPENRGTVFSVFNLTDSVGTGLGKFVGGVLSMGLGLGAALSISAAMWIPCGVFLLLCSSVFKPDIKKMQERLHASAEQLKTQ